MGESDVSNVIDKYIIEKGLLSGESFFSISKVLEKEIEVLFNVVKIDYENIGKFLSINIENKPSKDKYVFYFINHAIRRISDINWVFYSKDKDRLSRYSDIQIFGLVKLKDKLKNES